jgi:hypothetical protein
MEEPDGWLIEVADPQNPRNLHTTQIRRTDALSPDATRRMGRRDKRGMNGGHGGYRGGYEDFLRALGHELEQIPAYSLLIDELHDRFLITYQCFDPAVGYVPLKRIVCMSPREIEEMVEAAKTRRKHRLNPFHRRAG